jgi:hypothetical protein
MKKQTKALWRILAAALLFGFTSLFITGCDSGGGGGGGGGTAPVTGVSLDKTTLTISVGDMETLRATVTPDDAISKSVTWSSSNASVARVSSSGVVTGVSAGYAIVTVTTVSGSRTATCSIIVTPASNPTVTFNSLEEFSRWFSGQPANSNINTYNVKLNVSSISGLSDILHAVPRNYVSIDLSGSSITAIHENDFRYYQWLSWSNCETLTGINLPNSVTSIDEGAFSSFRNLASVSIGNGVTSIGKNTFYGCTNLTSLTIGNNVTSIGESAFENCSKLSSIIIPNSVTIIGDSAFDDCSNVSSLSIGNRVTSIGQYAFYWCGKITSVTIPASVSSIGRSAFYTLNLSILDTSLISVTFQGTIPSSGFGTTSYGYYTSPFDGDLREKFYATDPNNGTPGTYTRASGTDLWWKQ